MNISNYKAMVQNNFDKLLTDEAADRDKKALANKYNPAALQDKIKSFKFTKVNGDQLSN